MLRHQLQRATLAVALLLSVCSACLIVNCPKGGKRSLVHGKEALRQCPRCGPAEMGQCYGADICCGAEMGCAMASADTLVCRREQMSPEPCIGPSGGAPCGSSGKCAAPGVCCTPDSCTMDPTCRQTLSQELAGVYLYNPGNMRRIGLLSDTDEK